MSKRKGYYRKSPSRLTRIDTPPDHDAYRSDSDLRRDSFETMPPVLSGRNYNWPFIDSPSDLDRNSLYLLKEKKKVRYVEEPEILKGKTPPYSPSDASSSRSEPEFRVPKNVLHDDFQSRHLKHDTKPEMTKIPKPVKTDPSWRNKLRPLKKPEHEELIFEDLLREILREETRILTKSFVRDFAKNHLQKAAAYDIIMHLVEEIVTELGPVLTEDAIRDAWVDLIYEDVLESCTNEVVKETIVEHQKEMIDKYAKQTVLDGMVFDSLLSKITKEGKAFTKEESADILLDDLILTSLLEQYFLHLNMDKEEGINVV